MDLNSYGVKNASCSGFTGLVQIPKEVPKSWLCVISYVYYIHLIMRILLSQIQKTISKSRLCLTLYASYRHLITPNHVSLWWMRYLIFGLLWARCCTCCRLDNMAWPFNMGLLRNPSIVHGSCPCHLTSTKRNSPSTPWPLVDSDGNLRPCECVALQMIFCSKQKHHPGLT